MADQAVGDLMRSISNDVKQLVRDEVELAKAELKPAAKNAGIGAGALGAAAYFAISALLLLYFAAVYGLVAAGLPVWLSFLIVGVVLLLIGVVCGLVGLSLVKKVKGPQATISQAQQTVGELSAAAKRAMAAAKAPQIEGQVVDTKAIR
jgi:hypothetical protein